MRYILASFLCLHWAIVFALLAFICIDGDAGVAAVLAAFGAAAPGAQLASLENSIVLAPLATAFLVVAVLFCWALVELVANDSESGDAGEGVIRTAFVAALAVLSLVLTGGAVQGVDGLFVAVAVHLTALLTSCLAIVAERRSATAAQVLGSEDIRAAVRVMAQGAAHGSRLARISGRADANAREGC